MTANTVSAIEQSLQLTHTWLNELRDELELDTQDRAFKIMRAFLHNVRDHLTIDESAHLSAQLPMVLRGAYFEGWDPSQTPVRSRSRGEFTERFRERITPLGASGHDPEDALRAAFNVMHRHVDAGEYSDVMGMLPNDVRELVTAS